MTDLLDRARIARGSTADFAAVIATLIAAFEADPAVRALYPSTDEYRRHFPGFASAFGGRAFAQGHVDRSADGSAAALWLPPGIAPDDEAVGAHLERSIPAHRQPALFAGFAIQARLHPHEPHWYLPLIGTRPAAQGTGLGSALLETGLARADRDRAPTYLEATSRRSINLYRRHGFQHIGTVSIPDYPEIFAMWRPAR